MHGAAFDRLAVQAAGPALRSLYFEYMHADQDFRETASVVDSQCVHALHARRLDEESRGRAAAAASLQPHSRRAFSLRRAAR